jgi:hypothetical protein
VKESASSLRVILHDTKSLTRFWTAWSRSPSRTNETYRTGLFTRRDPILPSIGQRACVRACVDLLSLFRPSVRPDLKLSFINSATDSSPFPLLKPLSYSIQIIYPVRSLCLPPKFSLISFSLCFPKKHPSAVHTGC